MGLHEWGKDDFETKGSATASSKDFEFDLGVIDATYSKEELYEKLLESYLDKHKIKEELETGTVVILSGLAERKINALLSSFRKLEWTVGLVGTYDKKMEAYYVQDVVVCEQDVSMTTVELTPKGNKDLAKIKNIIGWCHSHNDMNSFHSHTDLGTTATFGLGMTVNNKREFDVKIRKDLSIGLSVLVEGKVVMENDVLIDVKDWLEEAKPLIKHESSQVGYRMIYDDKSDEETRVEDDLDTCIWCYQKLPRSHKKRGKCILCDAEMHKKCMREISEEGKMCYECFWEENENVPEGTRGFSKDELIEYGYGYGE